MDQQSRFGTWESYLKHMERDGIWGDEMMINAAANDYKTIINVLSFPGSRLVIPILPQCKVWLGHICDCHFVSLLKAPVSQSQQSIKETQKEEHQELRDKQGELMSAADHVVHPTIYQTQEELTKDRGQLTMCEERPQHKQTSLSGLNSTKKSANWSSPQKNQIYPAAYKVNDSDTEPSEEIVRIGKFDQKDLPYLALDMLVTGKWRNIAVDLDVPVDELNCIDNSDEYEKCYKMWKTWIERNGDAASYKKLAEVLKDHELQIIRENYCLEGNHPPLQETVATSTSENVKQGKIDDKDFMKIAKTIQGKRYRLGRVLGVRDSELEQITAKDPGDIWEQSYRILKKWQSANGKRATFTALAKALRDRTVALKEVVEEFCLVK
ncbi:uncharacterized protein LOC111346923 isoform X2 [Stylophora pistillata]|nr:uncharacterized protein LOC111346923 isoform X2 [Stylophora pistillata]